MKVEFRKSFTKDLKTISDEGILKRIKELIEAIERADALSEIPNRKNLKALEIIFV